MSASWPDSWTGNENFWEGATEISCGECGRILTFVDLQRQPNGIHERNFRLIEERWETFWPILQRCTDKPGGAPVLFWVAHLY